MIIELLIGIVALLYMLGAIVVAIFSFYMRNMQNFSKKKHNNTQNKNDKNRVGIKQTCKGIMFAYVYGLADTILFLLRKFPVMQYE